MAAPIGACFGAPCITCRLLACALDSKAAGGGGAKERVAAWLVLRAHGTPTMKRWLFDVRSGTNKGGLPQRVLPKKME